MIKFASLIVLCGTMGFATAADYCQEPITINEFPGGIIQSVGSLILFGTVGQFTGCPTNNPVTEDKVKFYLYNRDNPINPILLDLHNPVGVDSNKLTILIVHGWTCSVNGTRMPEIRQAYLKRYDCNVIGIDWSARSVDLYPNAFCAVPGVGKIIGQFLCTLKELFKVDLTQQIHMAGHSLGAHVSGYAGQDVQKRCNSRIARITGMDPAGPFFVGKPPAERLDSSDAEFVDIIHSNGGVLGYYEECGHVDFYPNCGTNQVGCKTFTTMEQIINLPISVAACNHFRSCDYLIESIVPTNKVFAATSCETCPGLSLPETCPADLFNPKYNVMGEDCSNNTQASKFQLRTNSQSPFARG